MLSQSRDPTQLRTSAHLWKLDSQNSGEFRPPRQILLSLQTNYYELLQGVYLTITKFLKKYLIILPTETCYFAIKSERFFIYWIEMN